MIGYLPIPQSIAHEGPNEVILRFSTGPSNPTLVGTSANPPGEVFLHAVGATAAFGQSFTPSDEPFTINSGPIILVHSDSDGCLPLEVEDLGQPFIILLDRGGCTFLEKLIHASRAGASGVIVSGLPPTSSDPVEQDGLIRPSAEGEASDYVREVEDKSMVYVDWRTGDILRDMFESSDDKMVHVEVLGLDGQVAQDNEMEADIGSRLEGAGRASREGRVGIGEWPIWNLRIVDGS
jgi:mannosidase alpha-like ER degradation enhancer 1